MYNEICNTKYIFDIKMTIHMTITFSASCGMIYISKFFCQTLEIKKNIQFLLFYRTSYAKSFI